MPDARALAGRIIATYDSWIIRAYCVVRFRIIRGRFLEEMATELPESGTAMEIGCGFGLFGLYFSSMRPGLTIRAVDLDADRIGAAERARDRLGLTNIAFEVGDARDVAIPDGLDAVYMLDIVHHLPPDAARELLRSCRRALAPNGVLIIKDVDTRPWVKMAFTWLLDVAMTRGECPHYWSRQALTAELEGLGLSVERRPMVDVLPYPHQLYVCRSVEAASGSAP